MKKNPNSVWSAQQAAFINDLMNPETRIKTGKELYLEVAAVGDKIRKEKIEKLGDVEV